MKRGGSRSPDWILTDKMQGWTSNNNFLSERVVLFEEIVFFWYIYIFLLLTKSGSFEWCGLCGLVLLQSCDVQRRRGPSAPLAQLPFLEEEVEGGQGDARLRWGLTKRVRHATVHVRGLQAVLPTKGKSHRSDHQVEWTICGSRINFSGTNYNGHIPVVCLHQPSVTNRHVAIYIHVRPKYHYIIILSF